jgi:hypothetical protein
MHPTHPRLLPTLLQSCPQTFEPLPFCTPLIRHLHLLNPPSTIPQPPIPLVDAHGLHSLNSPFLFGTNHLPWSPDGNLRRSSPSMIVIPVCSVAPPCLPFHTIASCPVSTFFFQPPHLRFAHQGSGTGRSSLTAFITMRVGINRSFIASSLPRCVARDSLWCRWKALHHSVLCVVL